jgi:N-acetylated-alpha-linked acidic dipeptidase
MRSLIRAGAALLIAAEIAAQQPRMVGYSPAEAARQRMAESAAVARPNPLRAGIHARALAEAPHVAGTQAQSATRDYVIQEMRAMGLATEIREYLVWMPHPVEVRAWRINPVQQELDVSERAIAEDPTSAAYPRVLPIAGYGAAGDVTGEVVYANFGLMEDYAILDSAGVSVAGKIVIARYGRSFRGIKAREAEKRGAIGLFVYSDPADDGFTLGDPYPHGPMRPAQGVQRGSFMNGVGDPSTPGYPSVGDAPRLHADSMATPRIPIIPISHANAAELMRDLRGRDIPQSWQGGMSFRYHIGPGPVTARMRVVTDAATAALKPIWNTFGVIRGSEFPEELVILGAHRDAWGPGAADNVSGTTSVLEAARAVMEQVKAGWRPRRTLVFATWDAEEWGLIGSTEHVEEDSLRLLRGGVAYLNQDGVAQGPRFGAGGSPSLRAMLRDVLRTVPYPGDSTSVYQTWRNQLRVPAGTEPVMGDPGGGSDFAGFYNHLGIPHLDWGFSGPGGVYHSAYDSYWWMSRFGDPGFGRHAAAARIGTALIMRLANAEVLPYDYVEFARTMKRNLEAPLFSGAASSLTDLRSALTAFENAATAFAVTRDSALLRALPAATRARANQFLLGVERSLTRPSGLRNRPWYRNLIYAADHDNGYATMPFPSIGEAIRDGNAQVVASEITDLATRFRAAADQLDAARAALSGPR